MWEEETSEECLLLGHVRVVMHRTRFAVGRVFFCLYIYYLSVQVHGQLLAFQISIVQYPAIVFYQSQNIKHSVPPPSCFKFTYSDYKAIYKYYNNTLLVLYIALE